MTTRTVAALGAVIAVLGASATALAMGPPSSRDLGTTRALQAPVAGDMMGGPGNSGGMMMGGASPKSGTMMGGRSLGAGSMMGGADRMAITNAGLLSVGALHALVDAGDVGAVIDRTADTVRYTTTSVTLVALASPDNKPNMTWDIDGLTNPTITVPAGAHITVQLVNADWGYMHGFELTTTPPPYPFMTMMGIANEFLVMPLPERTSKDLAGARFYTRSDSFRPAGGTYYYLCPVPGHAQQGMYGRLVVQSYVKPGAA